MTDTPHYRIGEVHYNGTDFAGKLRTDLGYLVSMAILSLDTPIRTHDKPYIQVESHETRLDVNREIAPAAALVLGQLIHDVPALKGAQLKVRNGFGGGTLMFESTSPETLKSELVSVGQALAPETTVMKSIHTALAPLQVHAATMA